MILVDQLRFPQWTTGASVGSGLPPNLDRLRRGAVTFARHYTASNDCTPARATLLTGLHTHQTGCMITGGSTLDHGFPTWGTMLREHGYDTRWYGKWHLTHHDNRWTARAGERDARALRLRRAAPSPPPTARPDRAGAWIRTSRGSSRSGSPPRATAAHGAPPSPS